ncbi:sulfite exporter TauE/SafE family protein [Shewanella yunxiaonensis]|uniref:Probable membrane transporter protein n=1 Tax=Shewanella yunxiaonensis TaxID=2829809 RepID=A0ABX7YV94_9GAMM|nr:MULTISPECIES: sulfite exporter TauE/SafE family protein [Shewanella]MDF0534945.1 sulfite exporter TauE/SafE family protein [Shewanella sp. A32]QUN06241.1 sulfite exporter TauE/SafE family protein [Shewanella yunxiaonensis]
MPIELALGLIAAVTSIVTAIIGFGGGMLLIAVMPLFLPAAVIIPIHGFTQLASNASRMAFDLQNVNRQLLWPFLIGSIAGIAVFGWLLLNIHSDYIPLAIGIYLLLNTWSTWFARLILRYENFYLVGFLQTGLGLVVGATGPLGLSILNKHIDDHNEVIATSSMFMTITHLSKLAVFGVMGFALWDYLPVLLTMTLCSIAGSFIGTRLRHKVQREQIKPVIKILLTLLALNMIAKVLL